MTSHRASVRRSLSLLLMLIVTATATAGMAKVASAATTSAGSPQAAAAPSPVLLPGFTQTLVAGGLKNPVAVAFAPSGEMWVATQPGGIYRMRNGGLQTVATLPVDFTAELGLMGLAFDPNYTSNGYIYVSYVNTRAFSRLSRFTAVNGVANLSTEKVLVEGTQQQTQFGPGEAVRVGPDGKLWWSVGSNPYPWGNGQALTNIYGKVIRLNLDGTVPSDDPFTGVPGAAPGIYAWGLRNPWRTTFLPNGKMMAGNTGESTWEMLDTIEPGANYGWPFYEGNCGSCGYANPVYAYGHLPADGAISAIAAYTGNHFPNAYDHVVFVGDYNRRDIHAVTFDPTYQTEVSDTVFASNEGTVADLTEGPDGNLYFVGVFEGNVWKITATGPFAPTAAASATPTGGTAPLQVQFSSAGSSDAYGKALTYSWNFGDGSPASTSANPTHTYTSNGTYTATLTATSGSTSAQATSRVVVGRKPAAASITAPALNATYSAGDTISFSGSATDPVEGTLPAADYTWQVDFYRNGVPQPTYLRESPHPFLGPTSGVNHGSFTIPDDVSQVPDSFYRITLAVVNSAGIPTVVTRDIRPHLTSWTVKSNQSGAGFLVDGSWQTSATVPDVVGVKHALIGGPEQTIAAQGYRFNGWADGSGLVDRFTTRSTTSAYTANYEPVSHTLSAPWQSADIGGPLVPGNAAYASASQSFYVDGTGTDAGGTGEQFHYVYQTLSGDSTITARVRYQTESHPWAKAGIMIKQSTAAGSPYVAALVTPDVSPNLPNVNGINCTPHGCDGWLPPVSPPVGHGMRMQSSGGTASITTAVPGFADPNKWLKLQRTGNTFATWYSTDGANWSPIGSTTVSMSGPVTVGLFSLSHETHWFSSAAFDHVQVASSGGPPPPSCPTAWTCADIGGPSQTGGASITGGTWTIQGGGSDIHGTADQLQFDYQTLAADGGISAHVTSQTNTNPWAKAGVMLRSGTDPGAANYALLVSPGNGVFVQYRSTQGGTTNRISAVSGVVPQYLRVARSGSTFTAYTSTDGSAWTPLAGSAVTLNVPGSMLAGLAVTSHNTSSLCTVTMDGVLVS
jgi:glucose/arabinose dehydrogenase